MKAFFIDKDNHIISKGNDDRLKAAKWYQRLFARLSNSYRNRFIDCDGFNIDFIDASYFLSDEFESWWEDVGSGITPNPDDDFESHAKRVSRELYKHLTEDET